MKFNSVILSLTLPLIPSPLSLSLPHSPSLSLVDISPLPTPHTILLDTKFRLVNPLHHARSLTETATISRIRLMLGEHTALALGVLVAADVLDTVLKPAHAYQLGT
jgi:Protein of unknown function (DUF1622)